MIGKSKALLKQNNQREKELTKENNQVLTDMVVYLRGSDLSDYNQELVRADLIEMVLDAQVRGDDIEKVFGENYQSICDEIIRAFPKRTTSQKVLSGIGNVLTCISVLTWILALQSGILIATNKESVMVAVTLGTLLNYLIITVAVTVGVNYFMRHVYDIDGKRKEKTKRCAVGEFLLLWLACALFIGALWGISLYFEQELFQVHIVVICIAAVASFLLGKGTEALQER